jgi:acetylornithine/N-succinyldiaminopimelate aminotransferase
VPGWPFLRALRQLADEHDLLLVFDEVQTGIGRTGKFFAYEWADVEPDILAVAKGLGGGFPIGACLATDHAAAGMVAGSHGSTFGGNPLAAAIGNAVLDVVLEDAFLENVQKMGLLLKQRLAEIKDHHTNIIEDIRGEGLLIGIKCWISNTELVNALRDEKMLAISAGDNIVRLLPPLIVGEAEISEACQKITSACSSLSNAPSQSQA